MSDFQYKVSVVIPVYNCAEHLERCAKSLTKQTIRKSQLEVIFVNDGSKDGSGEICKRLSEQYSFVKFFDKENGGVSSARNTGIRLAKGKYIMFLDADDTLSKNTLKAVTGFFDKHYDEVDLVTYKIIPYWKKQRYALHSRFKVLGDSGVYDLNEGQNCYICQTTMNICIKNLGEGKTPLFDEKLKFHEDINYCCGIVRDKMKIGYCKEAEYYYLRHPSSTTDRRGFAYYIFEDTMAMWERLFAPYGDKVPRYYQAIYLNDLNWKTIQDRLLPYYYSEAKFDRSVERILALVKKIDDDVILERPGMDLYHKHFLINFKQSGKVALQCDEDALRLVYNGETTSLLEQGETVYETEKVCVVADRLKVRGGSFIFDGFLKSPIFMYCGKPEVNLIIDGESRPLEMTHSENEHYKAGIRTGTFWRVQFEFDCAKVNDFRIEVRVNGVGYGTTFYYGPHSSIAQHRRFKGFSARGLVCREANGAFTVRHFPSFGAAALMLQMLISNFFCYLRIKPAVIPNRITGYLHRAKRGSVWIYLDRYGVFDNAYDQFKHDIGKEDGVERYYILNECDLDKLNERFTTEEKEHIVIFGSHRHKELYFECDKLITSFSNLSNVCPFSAGPMRWYADLTKYELIYLQHGILHASLRKMYSKECTPIDKIVVSSEFEVKNLTENYGYSESDLIRSCMPRYDGMEISGKKKNRLLFSPSWRSNLIGPLVNNERKEEPEAFLNSPFCKQVTAFLNSERLHDLLVKNDLYLDFQNHPIFRCYNSLLNITNDRVCTDSSARQDEYRLMITDYSSIVFDSVYLGCPIIYFVPDYAEFLAGVSHNYRKLDLPLEEGFGPFTEDADSLIDRLEECIAAGFVPQEPYRSRMESFFLYRDDKCRDRLYDSLMTK